eukprot:6328680-Prymnesium_polylepis.1
MTIRSDVLCLSLCHGFFHKYCTPWASQSHASAHQLFQHRLQPTQPLGHGAQLVINVTSRPVGCFAPVAGLGEHLSTSRCRWR